MAEFVPDKILELEDSVENNADINVENLCKLAIYYEKHRNEVKLKRYYEMAIEMKLLKAYYLYGNWYNKHKNYKKMAEYFTIAIEMYLNKEYLELEFTTEKSEDEEDEYIENFVTKMMELLGIYYDNFTTENETEETKVLVIKYYKMAIERHSINAMFNLGHFYYECSDYENMFIYYELAVKSRDIDTMYELSIYYQSQLDFDNMMKYYLMALEEENRSDHMDIALNDGEKYFDLFILKEELEKIEDKPLYLLKRLQKINCNRDIMIYENKKKIFAQLNHIAECCVCYETKLNINLDCGHCFCITCYPKLYKIPCPICRI